MNNQIKTLSLSEVLLRLNEGGTVEEIQAQIRDVTRRVLETGNAGKVTIALSFARDGGEGSRRLIVKDQVTSVMPKLPKPVTLFFATDECDLTRQNPDQPSLDRMETK